MAQPLIKKPLFPISRLYYQASKDIVPGEELLVSYGREYQEVLGIYEEYNASKVPTFSANFSKIKLQENVLGNFTKPVPQLNDHCRGGHQQHLRPNPRPKAGVKTTTN